VVSCLLLYPGQAEFTVAHANPPTVHPRDSPFALAEVFRGKSAALSPKLLPGYGFHGVTAILSLWLFMKALS